MLPIRLTTLAAAVVSASSSPALPQQKSPAPVFPAGTGLVLVDLVVVDKSDRPVGSLKAQDFVVKEDGKERPIVSFAAFAKGQSIETGPADALVDGTAKATPAAINAGSPTTVLYVDDTQLRPQEVARLAPALKKLVDVIAEQKGVLALVAPASGVQMADEAEGHRAVFFAAIDKIVGQRVDDNSPYPLSDAEAILGAQGDTPTIERLAARFVYLNRGLLKYDMALITARGRVNEVAMAAKFRRRFAYEVLLKSFDFLSGKPGRRSIFMVSGGYASDTEDEMHHAVVNRSLQVNAPIHFLDARGLQGISRYLGVEYRKALEYDAVEPPGAFSEAAAGTSGLVDDTGGFYVRNTNDMIKGVTSILDMSGTYYVLGYEPPAHEKRGFRKIKVEVATKGLKVMARRGYFDEAVAAR
jgi:VWFA-related protein